MEKEDKQLLFSDLCARLPYGVKCQFEYIIVTDGESSPFYDYVLSAHHLELFMRHNNFYIKPYLRPMSSMTEEEKKEYTSYCFEQPFLQKGKTPNLGSVPMCIDWLNKKMFDYRGLIPKNLAISTEIFNPYNKD